MWAGEGGPLLVLVGEVLAGGAAWAPHLRLLTDRFRVVTITPIATACAAEGLPLAAKVSHGTAPGGPLPRRGRLVGWREQTFGFRPQLDFANLA